MVVVVLSGFVGRYLYVRIPRTLRGTELTRTELDSRAEALLGELSRLRDADPWIERVQQIERDTAGEHQRRSFVGLLFGEVGLRLRLRRLAQEMRAGGLSAGVRMSLTALMTERALLVRRIAYLQKTKQAFQLWHVFHLPLVYLLLLIVAGHVALVAYLGYVPFRW
jgi:hypothetical protein